MKGSRGLGNTTTVHVYGTYPNPTQLSSDSNDLNLNEIQLEEIPPNLSQEVP